MKWLYATAKPLIYNRGDRARFTSDLARFAKARDSRQPHGNLIHQLMFDNLVHGELQFAEGAHRYTVTLTMGHIYIRETRSYNGDNNISKRFLTAGTTHSLPAALTESLIGAMAESVIELPDVLQPVITGRKIEKYSQFDEWLTFFLSIQTW